MLIAILKKGIFFQYSIVCFFARGILLFGLCGALYAVGGNEPDSEPEMVLEENHQPTDVKDLRRMPYVSQCSHDSGFGSLPSDINNDESEEDLDYRGGFVSSFHTVNIDNEQGLTLDDIARIEHVRGNELWLMVNQYDIQVNELSVGHLKVMDRLSERKNKERRIRHEIKLQYSNWMENMRSIQFPKVFSTSHIGSFCESLVCLLNQLNAQNTQVEYIFVFNEVDGYISNISVESNGFHKSEVSYFPLSEYQESSSLVKRVCNVFSSRTYNPSTDVLFNPFALLRSIHTEIQEKRDIRYTVEEYYSRGIISGRKVLLGRQEGLDYQNSNNLSISRSSSTDNLMRVDYMPVLEAGMGSVVISFVDQSYHSNSGSLTVSNLYENLMRVQNYYLIFQPVR